VRALSPAALYPKISEFSLEDWHAQEKYAVYRISYEQRSSQQIVTKQYMCLAAEAQIIAETEVEL